MVLRSSRRTAGLLRLFIGALFFLGLLPGNGPPSVRAASVTLAWDASTEAEVAGYKLYFGTASGVYTGSIDVGLQTSYTVSGVNDAATYFFTATAYDGAGRQSPYSPRLRLLALPASFHSPHQKVRHCPLAAAPARFRYPLLSRPVHGQPRPVPPGSPSREAIAGQAPAWPFSVCLRTKPNMAGPAP